MLTCIFIPHRHYCRLSTTIEFKKQDRLCESRWAALYEDRTLRIIQNLLPRPLFSQPFFLPLPIEPSCSLG